MTLFLAIDGGGTNTRCLLADESRVLSRASTGTVKLTRVDEAEALARLDAMLSETAESAGASLSAISRTCFGLAGTGSERVRRWAMEAIAKLAGGELVLRGDEEIALDAAFRGGPGILLLAGTGSNAIGRTMDGTLYRAGGWGPVLGDEGSGHWIGLEAIRASLRAIDKDQQRTMAEKLLRRIEIASEASSLGDLVARGNLRVASKLGAPLDYAALVDVVVDSAAEGNTIAADVLLRAGRELAALVSLVCRKMGRCAPLEIVFAGSILAKIPAVMRSFRASIAAEDPSLRVLEEPVDPLDGALWCARGS